MDARRSTRKFVVYGLAIAILSSFLSVLLYAQIKPPQKSPGLQPFTPTRIDWLALRLQAALREDETDTTGFQLDIGTDDPETILIYVRHLSDVNREAMNIAIDDARKMIGITAKEYGWERWVKIKEDVQLEPPPTANQPSRPTR